MTHESPFTLARFEHERMHVYFLPPSVFSKLEGPKAVFLIGSRGTGKTTLLTALSWREQFNNPNLTKKLPKSGKRGYIGIYIRMPDFVLATFDYWLQSAGDEPRARVFSFYLDLIWLKDLCDAIADHLVRRIIRAPIAAEYKIIANLLEEYPNILTEQDVMCPRTLKDIAKVLERKRRLLEKFVAEEGLHEELFKLVPPGQIGEFGRTAARVLLPFCNQRGRPIVDWQFKICLDESECLSPFQQRVLNTAVRLSRYPVTFVISYVRPMDDMSSTLLPSMSLSHADRETIHLDNFSDAEFSEFSSGVASVRVENRLQKANLKFNIRSVLGTLDINELLFDILKAAESRKAKDLLRAAEEFAETDFYKDIQAESTRKSKFPPIYQAYLISRRQVDVPGTSSEKWQRRAQDSAEIRKRMVAAYLCICKEFKHDVRYASADMLEQMSDGCIRDYLLQMNEVFVEARQPLRQFLNRKVPLVEQDSALKRASRKKRDFLPRSGVGSPRETELLIDGLAQLTERIQTSGADRPATGESGIRALASTERGVFVLSASSARAEDMQSSIPQHADAFRIITEAADTGFLRIIERSKEKWRFRVHCSLAAAYGFSYRGAYYDTPIRASDVIALFGETEPQKRTRLIQSIGARLAGEVPETASLFEPV
jgi:hypothetical protein